jgi:hypothetical protein
MHATCIAELVTLDFLIILQFSDDEKLWVSPLCNFLQSSISSCVLSLSMFFNFFLNPVWHMHKTTRKIIIFFCILIFCWWSCQEGWDGYGIVHQMYDRCVAILVKKPEGKISCWRQGVGGQIILHLSIENRVWPCELDLCVLLRGPMVAVEHGIEPLMWRTGNFLTSWETVSFLS